MRAKHVLYALWGAGLCLWAKTPTGVSLKVSNETVPAGAVTQVKVFLTEPKPIASFDGGGSYDSWGFDGILGIAMYNPGGDAAGLAQLSPGRIGFRVVSPRALYGTTAPDYPLLMIAMKVKSTLFPGTRMAVSVDLPTSTFFDPMGLPYPTEATPGSVTVGGSLSVGNVVPGGGLVAANHPILIQGTGFRPDTQVAVELPVAPTVSVVDSGTIRLAFPTAVNLEGTRVRVKNKDGSLATYFSYLRATAVNPSTNPLVASAYPVFSPAVFKDGLAVPPATSLTRTGAFTGFAVQNPNATTAKVLAEIYSGLNQPVAKFEFKLEPYTKLSADCAEVFGGRRVEPGGYVRVRSEAGVQFMGLSGNSVTNEVLPVPAVAVAPGTF